MQIIQSASRFSLSVLANTALITVSGALAASAIGLTALYLVEYIDETPSMRTLRCMVGLTQENCLRYDKEMDALQSKLELLKREIANAEQKTVEAEEKLVNLRRIETAIDKVTLFETHKVPNSTLTITVGTVYSRLLDPELAPQYFCYVDLARGAANESRNLHFNSTSGPVELSKANLRKADVSDSTLQFGHSVCKPFLIGQSG